MFKLLFTILFLAVASMGVAQRPDTPTGAGPSREERGPDQQPVLRKGVPSEETPVIQKHIEEQGTLLPNMASPSESGTVAIPRNPAIEQSGVEPLAAYLPWMVLAAIAGVALVLLFKLKLLPHP